MPNKVIKFETEEEAWEFIESSLNERAGINQQWKDEGNVTRTVAEPTREVIEMEDDEDGVPIPTKFGKWEVQIPEEFFGTKYALKKFQKKAITRDAFLLQKDKDKLTDKTIPTIKMKKNTI